MTTWKATIKLGSGYNTVTVQSDNISHARALLEMQYGPGVIINLQKA